MNHPVPFDDRLRAALHEVPVPSGLSERLLAQLVEAEAKRAAVIDPPSVPLAPPQVALAGRSPRRRWLIVAASLLATAASLVGLAMWLNRGDDITGDRVAQDITLWLTQLDPAEWHAANADAGFPLDPAVRRFHERWQRLSLFTKNDAIVFAGMTADQVPAYLIVVDTSRGRQLPELPPWEPIPATGGYSVGAWQTDGHLYVLAVRGDSRAYRSLLKAQSEFA